MKRKVKHLLTVFTALLLFTIMGYSFHDTLNRDFTAKAEIPSVVQASPEEEPSRLLPVGTDAPEFRLDGIDGKTYTLSEFTGKKVVLMEFFSSMCPHCQRSVPFIKVLEQEHPEKLQVMAINAGDKPNGPSTSKAFKDAFEVDYPILEKPTVFMMDRYGLRAFPTFYLIGKDNKVLWAQEGEMLPADIQKLGEMVEKS